MSSVIGNSDDIIQILLQIRENLVARRLYCSTVGNGADGRKCGHLLCLLAGIACMQFSSCGLHADNLDIGIQKLRQGGNAGGQSASSDRHQNVVHQRKLLYNLHGNGSLAGGNRQIVEGMDKGTGLAPAASL